jgi:hypothetical protein
MTIIFKENPKTEEYLSRITQVHLGGFRQSSQSRGRIYFNVDTPFSDMVYGTALMLNQGYNENLDLFADMGTNASGVYLVRPSELEFAIQKYVSPENREKVREKICEFGEGYPMGMIACEAILATNGIHVPRGYLNLHQEYNAVRNKVTDVS